MAAGHFQDSGTHARLLGIVRRTCDERLRGTPDAGEDSLVHGSALEHYLTTYGSPDLPPSWRRIRHELRQAVHGGVYVAERAVQHDEVARPQKP